MHRSTSLSPLEEGVFTAITAMWNDRISFQMNTALPFLIVGIRTGHFGAGRFPPVLEHLAQFSHPFRHFVSEIMSFAHNVGSASK